jgi:CRP/FNR family cyclic AMP-dependent transcriptional regulator
MARMALTALDRSIGHDALRACRLFADIDEGSLDRCVDAMRQRRSRRGEVIFHQGDPADALFVVVSGSVKILVPAGDGAEAAILTTIGPGGFFGELALLDDAPRSATAEALEPAVTLILRREAFDQLLDTEPGMRRALLAALAAEIRRMTAQIEDLHFLDLPGRLASHLLRMIGDDGAERDDEARLPWPYTQAELAGMIGGSRQSVNRLLADLVAEDLVRFDGETLVVPDPRRLAESVRR